MNAVLRAFGLGLFDYAGLYPPAALEMDAAVGEFIRLRSRPTAWLGACFVVDAARLAALVAEFRASPPTAPVPISLLAGTRGPLKRDLDLVDESIADFQQIETLVPSPFTQDAGLEQLRQIRQHCKRFDPKRICLEIRPDNPSLSSVAQSVTDSNTESGDRLLALKVRCGGASPTDVPSIDDLATFLLTCSTSDIPFKATAGLHHPVRNSGHGFLNVFLAAILVRRTGSDRPPRERVLELLADADASNFTLHPDAIGWRDIRFGETEVAVARTEFALSIGSCSIAEPAEGLQALGWL